MHSSRVREESLKETRRVPLSGGDTTMGNSDPATIPQEVGKIFQRGRGSNGEPSSCGEAGWWINSDNASSPTPGTDIVERDLCLFSPPGVAPVGWTITKIKHPMEMGRKGQKGIEW